MCGNLFDYSCPDCANEPCSCILATMVAEDDDAGTDDEQGCCFNCGEDLGQCMCLGRSLVAAMGRLS